MTKLADVLSFAGVPERIADPARERFVTLRIRGRGAVERLIKDGKTPVPFTGYRVRSGQFVYSRIDARNGAFALVPAELDGAVVSKDFPVFEIRRDRVDPNYLRHLFLGGLLQASIRAASFGATNRQRIDESVLLGFDVPLPALDQQRRIVAALDAAEALRANRRSLLAQFDSLTRSLFFARFGNPLAPPAGATTARIGSVARVATGNSPSRAVLANFGQEIEWIKSDNLGGAVATRAEEGLSAQGRLRARIAPAGSVLVTCIAGSPASIGKCSLVDRDVAFNQQINAILPAEGLEPAFVLAQLKLAPQLVRLKSSGGMKGIVSKTAFEAIEILVPPLVLQRDFAARASAIDAERTKVEHALAVDDELFASLQSRAFSGGL